MEDLAISIDRRNAETLTTPPKCLLPGCQHDPPIQSTHHCERPGFPPRSTYHSSGSSKLAQDSGHAADQTCDHTVLPPSPSSHTKSGRFVQSSGHLAAATGSEGSPMEPTKQRERPVLPRSQPYGNEAHGTPAQASEHAAAATGLDGMSFEDTLWKYIPEDSDVALSIKQRKCVYSFRGDNSFTLGPEEAVLSAHEVLRYFSDLYGPSSPIHRTLIIQDINLDWCKALCSGFPGAVDPDFIARHIIHFGELPAVYEMEDLQNDLTKRYPHAGISIESPGNFLGVQMSLSNYAIGGNGFHIDLQIEPSSSEAQQHIRYLRNARPFASQWDFFERDESNKWRRRSTRVSCCRLEECFCKSEGSYHSQSTVAKKLYADLVLVNLIPDYGKSAEFSRLKSRDFFHRALHASSPSTFAKAPRLPLECRHTTEHSNILFHQLSKLFSFHTTQSVFKPRSYPPSTWLYQMNAQIFIWLLTEANWRAAVAYLEDQLKHLHQEATVVPSDQAFEILTGLRRQIVNAQSLMAGTWSQVEYESKSHCSFWHADEAILTAGEFWSQSRVRNVSVSSHQARTYDIRDIPGMLKASEDRLGSMARELNEEIQVMIGSVGVEDLKISRRSTEWTDGRAGCAGYDLFAHDARRGHIRDELQGNHRRHRS